MSTRFGRELAHLPFEDIEMDPSKDSAGWAHTPIQVTLREPHWVGGDPRVTLNGCATEKYKAKYKNDGISEGSILKR